MPLTRHEIAAIHAAAEAEREGAKVRLVPTYANETDMLSIEVNGHRRMLLSVCAWRQSFERLVAEAEAELGAARKGVAR